MSEDWRWQRKRRRCDAGSDPRAPLGCARADARVSNTTNQDLLTLCFADVTVAVCCYQPLTSSNESPQVAEASGAIRGMADFSGTLVLCEAG